MPSNEVSSSDLTEQSTEKETLAWITLQNTKLQHTLENINAASVALANSPSFPEPFRPQVISMYRNAMESENPDVGSIINDINNKFNVQLAAEGVINKKPLDVNLTTLDNTIQNNRGERIEAEDEYVRDSVVDVVTAEHAKTFLDRNIEYDNYLKNKNKGLNSNPKIEGIFINKIQQIISERIANARTQYDIKAVKLEDLKKLEDNSNNPLLKKAYKDLYKELKEKEGKTGNEEEVEEKGKAFLDRVLNTVSEGDNFDQLADSIKNSEDFDNYPDVVKATIKKRMETLKTIRGQEKKSIELDKKLLDENRKLEKFKEMDAKRIIWKERLKWIGKGMLVAGIGGAILSGGFSPLASISWSNIAIGSGLGAFAGSVAGYGLSEKFGKNVIIGKANLIIAQKEIIDYEKKYTEEEENEDKKDLKAKETLIKIAAIVSSSLSDGKIATEDMVKEFLKRSKIPDALAIY